MSNAAMPPPPKNTSAVQMYMMPMRLWSSVTNQLATLPFFHVTGYTASDLAATRARSLVDVRLRVIEERLHLCVRPAVADGRHQAPSVAHDAGETRRLRDQRVLREIRSVATLALHPMARRADSLELRAPELTRCGRADVRLVVRR